NGMTVGVKGPAGCAPTGDAVAVSSGVDVYMGGASHAVGVAVYTGGMTVGGKGVAVNIESDSGGTTVGGSIVTCASGAMAELVRCSQAARMTSACTQPCAGPSS